MFASPYPVSREILAGPVGRSCKLEVLIEDIHAGLKAQPYDHILAAGGYQHGAFKLSWVWCEEAHFTATAIT